MRHAPATIALQSFSNKVQIKNVKHKLNRTMINPYSIPYPNPWGLSLWNGNILSRPLVPSLYYHFDKKVILRNPLVTEFCHYPTILYKSHSIPIDNGLDTFLFLMEVVCSDMVQVQKVQVHLVFLFIQFIQFSQNWIGEYRNTQRNWPIKNISNFFRSDIIQLYILTIWERITTLPQITFWTRMCSNSRACTCYISSVRIMFNWGYSKETKQKICVLIQPTHLGIFDTAVGIQTTVSRLFLSLTLVLKHILWAYESEADNLLIELKETLVISVDLIAISAARSNKCKASIVGSPKHAAIWDTYRFQMSHLISFISLKRSFSSSYFLTKLQLSKGNTRHEFMLLFEFRLHFKDHYVCHRSDVQ